MNQQTRLVISTYEGWYFPIALHSSIVRAKLIALKGESKVRRRDMPYSKITSKGQMTIPVIARRKYGLEDGSIVMLEETKDGLLLKRAPDIIASAGALAELAEANDVVRDLVKSRRGAFR